MNFILFSVQRLYTRVPRYHVPCWDFYAMEEWRDSKRWLGLSVIWPLGYLIRGVARLMGKYET